MNDLYPEIEYEKMVLELQSVRSHEIKLSKEEYEIIIDAKKKGDFSKVFDTDIYKNHGGDYCALLQLLPYHTVRLLFADLPNGDTVVLNRDRIFNNDYLKIATIKNRIAYYHTTTIYPEERREIANHINN